MSDSLDILLADGIIDAVLGQLKTGKEAEVWLVQHAGQVVAAKIYKERHARNFRNNVGYREGREVRNSRTRRAMEKGSRFGQAASEEAWKSAEADALYALHAQGVRVPTPVMFYEGVLLMELVLDAEGQPAPRLVEAPPATPEDARALYLDLRAQVVRMLCADLIHGDLSPYNILMGAPGAIIIDFPQTVAAARNNRAEFYFRRDLDNVRLFLEGYDSRLRGLAGDTGEIWNAYVRRDLTPDFTPSGSWREQPRRQGQGGRPEGGGRRPDFRAAPPPAPPQPPAPSAEEAGLDPEEAELRALEAMVLRQGGGERSKPAALPPSKTGRKRPFGSGRPPPRQGGGGAPQRPPSGQPRAGGPSRPPGGAPQAGGPPQQARGQPHAGGRPTHGSGGAQQAGAPARHARTEPHAAGRPPRPPRGEPHAGSPSHPPRAEPHAAGRPPRPPRGEPHAGSPSRPPGAEPHAAGRPPRPPRGEPHAGSPSRPPGAEPHAAGRPPRPPRGEPYAASPALTPGGEPRGAGAPRGPRGEWREEQPGRGAPPTGRAGPPGGGREQRPGGGGGGAGPRAPRQGAERAGTRPQRTSPQVSYVGAGRPSDPHGTGS